MAAVQGHLAAQRGAQLGEQLVGVEVDLLCEEHVLEVIGHARPELGRTVRAHTEVFDGRYLRERFLRRLVQRGDKVRIGRIDITGNDPTYDKVVRREIPINEGDIYSGTALKESRLRLDRRGRRKARALAHRLEAVVERGVVEGLEG